MGRSLSLAGQCSSVQVFVSDKRSAIRMGRFLPLAGQGSAVQFERESCREAEHGAWHRLVVMPHRPPTPRQFSRPQRSSHKSRVPGRHFPGFPGYFALYPSAQTSVETRRVVPCKSLTPGRRFGKVGYLGGWESKKLLKKLSKQLFFRKLFRKLFR